MFKLHVLILSFLLVCGGLASFPGSSEASAGDQPPVLTVSERVDKKVGQTFNFSDGINITVEDDNILPGKPIQFVDGTARKLTDLGLGIKLFANQGNKRSWAICPVQGSPLRITEKMMGKYEIKVMATDSNGATVTKTMLINIEDKDGNYPPEIADVSFCHPTTGQTIKVFDGMLIRIEDDLIFSVGVKADFFGGKGRMMKHSGLIETGGCLGAVTPDGEHSAVWEIFWSQGRIGKRVITLWPATGKIENGRPKYDLVGKPFTFVMEIVDHRNKPDEAIQISGVSFWHPGKKESIKVYEGMDIKISDKSIFNVSVEAKFSKGSGRMLKHSGLVESRACLNAVNIVNDKTVVWEITWNTGKAGKYTITLSPATGKVENGQPKYELVGKPFSFNLEIVKGE